MSHEAVVRDATFDDLDRVAEIRNLGWLTAYRGIMADEVLDALDVVEEAERWRGFWPEFATNGQHLFVADIAGRVHGFALVRRQARDDDVEVGVGELIAIYLHPDDWAGGAGQTLLDRGVAHLRDQGCHAAVLWTFDANSRARRFYERNAWALDGTVDDHYGARAVRYRIHLAASVLPSITDP